jgi:hypothetical protein
VTKYIIFILSVLTSFFLYVTTIKNGMYLCDGGVCGIYYWGAHLVDGLWHTAIIQHSFDALPFSVPIFAGHSLSGYNYLLDLISYPLHQAGVSALVVYFKVLPVVWVFLMMWALWKVTQAMKGSRTYFASLLFTVFFGTGFYFLFALYHGLPLIGTDGFGGALTAVNMQFAYSLVGILVVMYLLLTATMNRTRMVSLSILVALITGLKFYSGVITMVLIGTYSFSAFLRTRKDVQRHVMELVVVTGMFMGAIILVYNPFSGAGTLGEPVFSVAPFALAHRLFEEPNRLFLPNLVNARYTLMEGPIGPRLILLEVFAVILYIFFEFGPRIIGFMTYITKAITRKASDMDHALMASILAGVIISLTFVQRGQWWNVIQFLYVSLFLISFHTAEAYSFLANRRSMFAWIVLVVLILCAVPFNLSVLNTFTKPSHGSYISSVELKALAALKGLPAGTVLRLPDHTAPVTPSKISHNLDASYIPVYADKPSYIEGIEILKILNVDYQKRLTAVQTADIPALARDVTYIYAFGPETQSCSFDMSIRRAAQKTLFSNEEVTIYSLE